MFDFILNKFFFLDNMNIYDFEFWEEVTLIWIINQRVGYVSGVVMWFGVDVKIYESFLTYYMFYNEFVLFEDRVVKIIEWFILKEFINFGFFYWEDFDDMGYYLGFDSLFMGFVILDIDNKLGYFI